VNDPSRNLRAVYFDVGETLVRTRQPYGELLAEVAGDLGIVLPEAAFNGLGEHVRARVAVRARRRLPFTFPPPESSRFWLETYEDFLAGVLPEADALALAGAFHTLLSSPAGYVLYEDTLPALLRLRKHGIPLGIISNWESWLPALLEATGLAPFFSHVVISGVCGLEKPDPRIFVRALQEGGLQAAEVAYVGDSPDHDIAPALRLGLNPVLLDRARRPPGPRLPTRRITRRALLHAVVRGGVERTVPRLRKPGRPVTAHRAAVPRAYRLTGVWITGRSGAAAKDAARRSSGARPYAVVR